MESSSGAKLLRKSGKVLLESGLFSDAEVSVGGKVWRVHKNILCTRSDYFKKAFTGQFTEAQTGKLKIHDQDHHDVELILKFIYTGKVQHDLYLSRRIELYKAADYFGIDSLQADILKNLDSWFRLEINIIWEYMESPDRPFESVVDHWGDDKLEEFFSAARVAYTDCPVFEGPRKCIAAFVKATCAILGKDPHFVKALKDVPELAVVMVELIMDTENQGARSMVYAERPAKCESCGTSSTVDPVGQTWVSHDTTSRKFEVYGLCHSCAKKNKE